MGQRDTSPNQVIQLYHSTKPRMLCNGIGVLPHLQMGFAVMEFVFKTSVTACIIHKHTLSALFGL